ncbi:MAG: hypothetical protein Q9O24_04210 [Gammaproteobacteria bacterium]|nr:hypothetical protein [Gammaproteobacteria bacterium]
MSKKYNLQDVRRDIAQDQAIAEQPDKTGTTVELDHDQIQKLVALNKKQNAVKKHGHS